MQRIGRVVKADQFGMTVRMERTAACRGCGACGRDIRPEVLFARGTAKTGDVVRLELDGGRSAKPCLLVYPLYTLGLMAGVIIANRFWEGSEPVMVLGGAAGLALSTLLLKLLSPRPAASRACGARAVSVNDPEDVRALNEGGICPKAAAWSSSG